MNQRHFEIWLIKEYGNILGQYCNASEKERDLTDGKRFMLDQIFEKLETDTTLVITEMIQQGEKVPGFPAKRDRA